MLATLELNHVLTCLISFLAEYIYGPYYSQLGFGQTLSEIRVKMEARTGKFTVIQIRALSRVVFDVFG